MNAIHGLLTELEANTRAGNLRWRRSFFGGHELEFEDVVIRLRRLENAVGYHDTVYVLEVRRPGLFGHVLESQVLDEGKGVSFWWHLESLERERLRPPAPPPSVVPHLIATLKELRALR